MNFTERLTEIQRHSNSLLSVGLDIDPSHLPVGIAHDAGGILEFNRRIIEATSDLVCAYKINLAFYEALGSDGWEILKKTRELIPRDVIAIGDGKRGDIGNTAERYAAALFDQLNFDAVTVNAYMGFDAVEPFLRNEARGVFILALTSNPGSKDFQRQRLVSGYLFEKMVKAAKRWNTRKNIGLVVGATHPKDLKTIRAAAPALPILIPGIGSQGGDLKAAVRYGTMKTGVGAIIHAGRSVIFASKGSDYSIAARNEAKKLRDEIRLLQL